MYVEYTLNLIIILIYLNRNVGQIFILFILRNKKHMDVQLLSLEIFINKIIIFCLYLFCFILYFICDR